MKITIIGAGPGGYETAVAAAKKGLEVVLITDGPLGGTCLNEGCIPTKALCRNAEVLEDLGKAASYGVDWLSYSFDFWKAIDRKDAIVRQLRTNLEYLMKNWKIPVIYGKASLRDAKTVVVKVDKEHELPEGMEAVKGKVEIRTDYIIIATGSVPAKLPVQGNAYKGVITSTEMLSLTEVPKRLCIVGAGVIGLEFASIFRTFGSDVLVIEHFRDVLPRFDSDLAKRVKHCLDKRGIDIDTQSQLKEIVELNAMKNGEIVSDGLRVTYVKKGEKREYIADKVLMAVGRRPNVKSLNLKDIGIASGPGGIEVNEYMQTSLKNIYAVGDVTGGAMLAHVATFQGYRALNHILAGQPSAGKVDDVDFSLIPAAVFTNPEAATVGLSEDECEARQLKFTVHKAFFRANGKAVSMDSPDGYCKILESGDDGSIIGCHIFGPHASDLIHEAAALMSKKATVRELQNIIHTHPTLSEIFQASARA